MTAFLRLIEYENKAEMLRSLVSGDLDQSDRYVLPPSALGAVPTSPFCYWVSDHVRSLFAGTSSQFLTARQGLATADDFRFVRAWFETVPKETRKTWWPAAKGGSRSAFYRDLSTTIRWANSGREIRNFVDPVTGRLRSRPQNIGWFMRPGVSWPLRGIRFSAQAVPRDSIFTIAGKMAFGPVEELGAHLAVINSAAYDSLMGMFAGKVGGVQYEAGLIERTPLPPTSFEERDRLSALARSGWSVARSLDTANEVSHAFIVPALLQVDESSFGPRVAEWAARVAGVEAELERVQSEIDDLCFDLYEMSEEDRRAITAGFGLSDSDSDAEKDEDDGDDEGVELDPAGLAAGLVSWAIGVGIGRFDARLATGEREWPAEPDPFDPLPVCSPGMLVGEDGMSLVVPPAGYPVEVSPVLVDDHGHELDITARVRSVFDVVFDADADSWWADVGTALGARGGEVASWLSKEFFAHHLKAHSKKTRRKAPILWPLGTASGSYLVWLYAHRVTGDSLFRVLNDIVSPKLALERRRLTDLFQEAGANPTAGQRRVIDAQERLVGELSDLTQELNAVAPLWYPDLNDGVVIVLAPLWRLFAHHRAWSKELRKHWDKLQAGDYDWAQLAMHLWPERVVPKCAEDRSLAIGHGLEDVFWVQDDNNPDRWHPRETPTIPIDELVAQRTNSTTKATLQDTRT